MVKIKISALFLAAMALSCCTHTSNGGATETLEIASGTLGRSVSLANIGGRLIVVYADGRTTSLCVAEVPLGPSLSKERPRAQVIDRIDLAPPLSPDFGKHVLVQRGEKTVVFYVDRRSDEKSVLKVASRANGSDPWTLDVVEPAGIPVGAFEDDGGDLALFWATDALLAQTLPIEPAPRLLLSPFSPSGRASILEQLPIEGVPGSSVRGFTVFDEARGSLLVFRWKRGDLQRGVVAGCGPVHSSVLAADGLLDILTWDKVTRRIVLLEEREGGADFLRTTVALSGDTRVVQMVPLPASARGRNGSYILFDDARHRGAVKTTYRLCVLEPGARFSKKIIRAADEPIEDISTVAVGGALYVLALQGGLTLLRLPF